MKAIEIIRQHQRLQKIAQANSFPVIKLSDHPKLLAETKEDFRMPLLKTIRFLIEHLKVNCEPDKFEYWGYYQLNCCMYTYAVAVKLHENHTNTLDFDNDDDPFVTRIADDWERFFDFENSTTELIGKTCPWMVLNDNKLSLPKSIIDFSVQLQLMGSTSIERLIHFDMYTHLPFINGMESMENLCRCLNRDVKDSISNKHLAADVINGDLHGHQLLALVYLSIKLRSFEKIASNALTILVLAKYPLSGRKFDGVQIPYADLSFGNFDNSSFRNANLNYVKATGASFRNADFTNASRIGLETQVKAGINSSFRNIGKCLFSQDYKYVFFVSYRSIQMWNYSENMILKTFSIGNRDIGRCIDTFMINGCSYIVASDSSGAIYVWNCEADNFSPFLKKGVLNQTIAGAYYSLHTQTIIIVSNIESNVEILSWNFKNNETRVLESFSTNNFSSVYLRTKLSPKGKILVNQVNGNIEIFNFETYKHITYEYTFSVSDFAFSPNEKLCAADIVNSKRARNILLIDIESNSEIIMSDPNITDSISSVCFSPDNNYLITGHINSNIFLWSIKDLNVVGVMDLSYQLPKSIKRVNSHPAKNISFIIYDKENYLTATLHERLMIWKYDKSLFIPFNKDSEHKLKISIASNNDICVTCNDEEILFIIYKTNNIVNKPDCLVLPENDPYSDYTLMVYDTTLNKKIITYTETQPLDNNLPLDTKHIITASGSHSWLLRINAYNKRSDYVIESDAPGNRTYIHDQITGLPKKSRQQLIDMNITTVQAIRANSNIDRMLSYVFIASMSGLSSGYFETIQKIKLKKSAKCYFFSRDLLYKDIAQNLNKKYDRAMITINNSENIICIWSIRKIYNDDSEIHIWEVIDKSNFVYAYDALALTSETLLLALRWKINKNLFANGIDLQGAIILKSFYQHLNRTEEYVPTYYIEGLKSSTNARKSNLSLKDIAKIKLTQLHASADPNHIIIQKFADIIEKIAKYDDVDTLRFLESCLNTDLSVPYNHYKLHFANNQNSLFSKNHNPKRPYQNEIISPDHSDKRISTKRKYF